MPAPLSVIIPCLNVADRIGPCLKALFEGVEAGLVREVIFADGGSGDEIAEIAEGVGAELVISASGRGTQLRAGADAATGTWYLFVHADTVLSEGWPAVVGAHIGGSGDAGFGQLAFDADGIAPRLVAAWANLRARMLGRPFGDQSLLISKRLYSQIGGFPDIPLMEDVAIARSLGARKTQLGYTAVSDFSKYAHEGVLRRGAKNLLLQLRFALGADPAKLAADYTAD